MLTRERLCWWCNKKLMTVSHATIKDHGGNSVQVHKVCKPAAERYVKPVTATTPDEIEMEILLRGGWSRKEAAPRLEQDLIDAAEEDGM